MFPTTSTFPVEGGVPELVHLWGQDLTEVVKGELLLVLQSRLQNQRVHQTLHLVYLGLALRQLQQRSDRGNPTELNHKIGG